MNEILLFIQNNSFLLGLLIAGGVAVVGGLLKFRDMKKEMAAEKEKLEAKIHSLHLRLKEVEETRMSKMEDNLEAQGKLLERIDERTKNTELSVNSLLNHLLESKKL